MEMKISLDIRGITAAPNESLRSLHIFSRCRLNEDVGFSYATGPTLGVVETKLKNTGRKFLPCSTNPDS